MTKVLQECIASLINAPQPSVHLLTCLLNFTTGKRFTNEQVAAALGPTGLNTIFSWLDFKDVEIRKLSALLLCELAYDNERIQVLISELYDFTPVSGRVCITKMPARIQTLLRERPELLDLIKKVDPEPGKYWCFPPLDPLNYRSSMENYQLFPDPKEYMVGFTCSKKKQINILNTTTSYISDHSSKTASPDHKVNLREPISYSPTLYNHPDEEYRAAPVEVRSPKAAKKPILRSIHAASPTKKESPKQSTAHKTYESIEASIRRIRGALQKSVGPETHSTRSQSPRYVDRNYLSPTAASIMKHRDKTPPSPRGSISGRPPSQIQERVVGNRKNLTLKLDNLMKKARRVSPSTESPRPPLSTRGHV